MRYISPSMHTVFCNKLKSAVVEPVSHSAKNEIGFDKMESQLEELYNVYKEKLNEIESISQQYLSLQNKARVHLRRQQVKKITKDK